MTDIICIACKGKGVVKRINTGKMSEIQKKKILIFYRKGLGIRDIARRLKVPNPYSVSYYIKTCNKNYYENK